MKRWFAIVLLLLICAVNVNAAKPRHHAAHRHKAHPAKRHPPHRRGA
ncbi:MAG TPA: hypothetical protein VEG68_09570 [Terriglobales bacterium]|nr:hypothetical protein [Terriglobales bacterium]